MAHARIQVGDLDVTVVDNEQWDEHRAGYNGIARLTSKHFSPSLFVPAFAGINLEHVLDGMTTGESDDFFEPRIAPMLLSHDGDDTVLLHQPATPRTLVESTTRFTVRPTHFIDVSCLIVVRGGEFPFGYLGLFWASYINGPMSNAMHFVGRTPDGIEGWLQLSSIYHGHESTVVGIDDEPALPLHDQAQRGLFSSFAPARFVHPFFFGLFGPMVFAVMFRDAKGIRLSHSPSGGGANVRRDGFNPAWDFQYIIDRPEVNKEYGWEAQIVYKPFEGKQDILDEYRTFSQMR